MSSDYQILHWVLKTPNLYKSEKFYKKLGLKLLRHEEFSQGCDAQCNGPYARPWSKTMIGYSEEKDNFCLELAFNYGITKYEIGNDLKYILVESDNEFQESNKCEDGNGVVVKHDGYNFKIKKSKENKIRGIALNVTSLQNAKFYTDVLGMKILKKENKIITLGYDDTITLELHETSEIKHGSAGRLAVSVPTSQLSVIEEQAKSLSKIHTPRIKLGTPGKASVEVVILLDFDGFEVCCVGKEAFFELAKNEDVKIDYEKRRENGSKE